MNKTGLLIFILIFAFFLTREIEKQSTGRPNSYFRDNSNLSSEILKDKKNIEKKIADTVIYLLENDYVSGEVIDVNAGRYMD